MDLMKSIDSFRPLEKEQFMVDVISSKKCNKCGLQISDSAGIILKSGEISFSHFHLDCYDPQNKSRVFKDNFVCAIPVEWTSERQSFIT